MKGAILTVLSFVAVLVAVALILAAGGFGIRAGHAAGARRMPQGSMILTEGEPTQ